jgi:hypothetical protein
MVKIASISDAGSTGADSRLSLTACFAVFQDQIAGSPFSQASRFMGNVRCDDIELLCPEDVQSSPGAISPDYHARNRIVRQLAKTSPGKLQTSPQKEPTG